ncbi:F-box/LRR-repeat protein At3g03360 [Ziziphus jujuba]|uniref:F-box/LRR-repeat protein At3g03360 n=1 Tax=Ziziphus jujuba TaxID=326968 RepID=A0ABM3ZUJ8_ZIZJJ|nr:F-box/LRR-repeat protein At3g03360 [Ziziphus jujuba]
MARERIFKKAKEDMMSKLPDEILVSIMRCLPTKQAARTSVVCQRWHKIWKITISIQPRLIFNLDKGWSSALRKKSLRDAAKDLAKKRINEVNAVLKLHEAPTLDEYSLIASKLEPKHRHHINTWMDFAAKKHVKKLTLQLRSKIGYNATFLADNFGCLRELYIQVILVGENSIHRLFSNTPFLELFSLLNSYTLYDFKIVSAPNLNYLQIEDCCSLENLEISSASNLKRLKIRGDVALQSVDISSAPNLSDLILGIDGPNFKLDHHLALLNQIKRLTLYIDVGYYLFSPS